MSKVCLLLLILNVVGMVSCMEQPPKQSRKQQGHQERLVKREVDLIKKNDHKIREYYRELAEVGLDGVTVMPIDKKVEYTDLAVELNFEILKRMGFQPVSDTEAQKALKKYYNIDISERNNSLFKKDFADMYLKTGYLKSVWNSVGLWTMELRKPYFAFGIGIFLFLNTTILYSIL